MAEPWEKYKADSEAGPWAKYNVPAPVEAPSAEQPSAVSRFFSSVGQAVNPVPMVKDWWENLRNQGKSVNALGKIMELREKGLKDEDPEMKAALDEAMGIKLPTSGNPAVTQVPFMSEPAIAAGRQAAGGDLAGAAGTMTGAYAVPAAVAGVIPYVKPGARAAGKAVADVVTSPPVIKGLKRSTEGVIVGSAMTGNIPGVAVGTAGRAAVGGLEAWIARRAAKASPALTESPVPSASGLTLDAVAQGFGYKSFKGIKNPADQASVTAAYERFVKAESGGGDIAPTPEATPPPTPGRFNSEEFRTPPQAAAPPVVEPPAPAIPATPAPSKRVGGVKQVGLDARKLTDKLVEWKLSPDEAAGMPKAGWVKLAFEAGVPAPTAAVQRSTIFGLKKALAGPPKTATELFEQFRKSGRVAAVGQ